MGLLGISITVFAITYGLIVTEKVHRTIVALAGGVCMVLLGVLTQDMALRGIDFNTLGLLIGMMVIVAIAKDSGMFQAVALWTAKAAKGHPGKIFLLMGMMVAILSSFLANVTTVLLMVPVMFVLANNLRVKPMAFLLGTILLSNIGGVFTLIGDPPNMLIGSAAGLSFSDFLVHLAPIGLVIAVVTLGLLYFWYRHDLQASPELQQRIANFRPSEAITDKRLLVKSLLVLVGVMTAFIFQQALHIEAATIALAGAALLMLLTIHDPEEHLRSVEWTTIFFFIGLFVLVAGIEHAGVLDRLARALVSLADTSPTLMTIGMLWVSAILSAVVDNIPFVATMIPLIQNLGTLSHIHLMPLWWALALGADIGGNATLVGASANVIVGDMAQREGCPIGFWSYMKMAVPLTVVGLVMATVYLYARYLI